MLGTKRQKGMDGRPVKPKKALSAYMLFSKDHRAEVVAGQDKNAKATDAMRELGARWRAAPESVKNEYKAKAEVAKAEHAKAMEEYRAALKAAGLEESVGGKGVTHSIASLLLDEPFSFQKAPAKKRQGKKKTGGGARKRKREVEVEVEVEVEGGEGKKVEEKETRGTLMFEVVASQEDEEGVQQKQKQKKKTSLAASTNTLLSAFAAAPGARRATNKNAMFE